MSSVLRGAIVLGVAQKWSNAIQVSYAQANAHKSPVKLEHIRIALDKQSVSLVVPQILPLVCTVMGVSRTKMVWFVHQGTIVP